MPDLPLDILVNTLRLLPAQRTLLDDCTIGVLVAFLQTNQLFREAASIPTLWRAHYLARYQHAEPEKEAQRKVEFQQDWKKLYVERRRIDQCALTYLRVLIEEPLRRQEVECHLLDMGMDIWDVLSLEADSFSNPDIILGLNGATEFHRPYHFTWKYWAGQVAAAITKQDAIYGWSKVVASPNVKGATGFEDALCYLSSFFGVPQCDILNTLHSLGDECKHYLERIGRNLDPEDPRYNLSVLCADICTFMRSTGLTPATSPVYQQLMNKFPHAYLSTNKATIPLPLVHVFVSLCRQLGIQAFPINSPHTVLAYVPLPGSSTPLIVNPFTDDTNNLAVLNNRTNWQADSVFPFPVFPGPRDQFLVPCLDPTVMLKRSSYNILNSVRDPLAQSSQLYSGTMCAIIIGFLLEDEAIILEGLFSAISLTLLDGRMLVRRLLNLVKGRQLQLLQAYYSDALRKHTDDPCPRSPHQSPKFFVGMAILHKKYDYHGVIYGWDAECKASSAWIEKMHVDQLARGGKQPFYHILCWDGEKSSARYVAEDNIAAVSITPRLAVSFSRVPEISKHFGSVEVHEGGQGFGRFIQSPESKHLYPEDYDYGSLWIERWKNAELM